MDHFLQIVIAGNFFLAICRSGQQFCNLSFRTVFLQIVVVNYFSQILQNVVPLIIFCIMFFICEDLGLNGFPKMRGGSKAVWNFTKNSSDLVVPPIPYVFNIKQPLKLLNIKYITD